MLGDARWFTSTSASGLHAARCRLAGVAAVDPRLKAPPLADELAALAADLRAAAVDPVDFFEHALPLAARADAPAQIVEVALLKLLGPPQYSDRAATLVRRLHGLWSALESSGFGQLDELELRSRPLRDQWEARGPGLLAAVARLTEADLVVAEADVVLVQPAAGGAGSAHPPYNTVIVEAVLANPLERLPEVVRLGWHWSCLNLDLPRFHELLGPRAARLGPLAVLPPTLAAAEEVELVRFDRTLLEAALAAWRAPPLDAGGLWEWWETYRASGPSWNVALAALEPLLGDRSSAP